jgi:hypothetical protein
MEGFLEILACISLTCTDMDMIMVNLFELVI